MTPIDPDKLFLENHYYILLSFWGLLPSNPLLKTVFRKNLCILDFLYIQISFLASVEKFKCSVNYLQKKHVREKFVRSSLLSFKA